MTTVYRPPEGVTQVTDRRTLLARTAREPINFYGTPTDVQEANEMCSTALSIWKECGLQSVRLPHTYAAALMATDAAEALRGQELPWPAFEIQVPPGLLTSSTGHEVFSIIVCRQAIDGATLYVYGTHDAGGFMSYAARVALDRVGVYRSDETLTVQDDLRALFDLKLEARVSTMVGRLIGGVVLAIAAARSSAPGSLSYVARPRREDKRGVPRTNDFVLGHPLKLDCRQAIRDFLEGRRSSSPTVTTLVRGHWRHQPHGPNREQRRLQWIQPFFRGEGPLLVRPTHIGGAS